MNIAGVVLIFCCSVYFLQLAKTGPNEKMLEKHEKKAGAPMTQEEIDAEKSKYKKFGIFGVCATIFFTAWYILDMVGYLSTNM